MNPELDRPFDFTARSIREIPAAVALFDRDLCYEAASKRWIAAFGLPRLPIAGWRHDELCRAGQEGLGEVQRRALAGETVEDYQLVDDEAVPNPRPAILRRDRIAAPTAASPA
jgi:hypothetical protein